MNTNQPAGSTDASDASSLAERWRRWIFLPIVAVGILGFFLLNLRSSDVQPAAVKEVARVLRVTEARTTDVKPRAIGYGLSRPGQTWQAVSEVGGRIVETHPDLAAGAFVPAGAVLLRIDDRDYQLALTMQQASIEQIEAQQAELTVQEESTRASLLIEERSLELAEQALQRKRSLREEGVLADEAIEAEERSVLAQRQSVQSLQNTLAQLPVQQESLAASLNSALAQMAQSERDLERVAIVAPFDCRLGPVSLEEHQFLSPGQILFEAYSVASTEVEARFTPGQLRTILNRVGAAADTLRLPSTMDDWRSLVGIEARVRIGGSDQLAAWPARFDRIRESVDPQTRTFGVVVVVDEPYRRAIPGRRPPLTKDIFCEVELSTQETVDALVIPRSSLTAGNVYVLDAENRLVRREVASGFAYGDFVTITSGIEAGELVVVEEPVPALEGMLVDPLVDAELMSRLASEARGEGAAR